MSLRLNGSEFQIGWDAWRAREDRMRRTMRRRDTLRLVVVIGAIILAFAALGMWSGAAL